MIFPQRGEQGWGWPLVIAKHTRSLSQHGHVPVPGPRQHRPAAWARAAPRHRHRASFSPHRPLVQEPVTPSNAFFFSSLLWGWNYSGFVRKKKKKKNGSEVLWKWKPPITLLKNNINLPSPFMKHSLSQMARDWRWAFDVEITPAGGALLMSVCHGAGGRRPCPWHRVGTGWPSGSLPPKPFLWFREVGTSHLQGTQGETPVFPLLPPISRCGHRWQR